MDIRHIWNGLVKMSGLVCVCAGLMIACPAESRAATVLAEVQTRSSYMVTIEALAVDVYTSPDTGSERQGRVMRGQTYEVLASQDKGWVKIRTGSREGYIKTTGKASLVERTSQTVDQTVKKRRQVVEFAMQFLGGDYVYGGTDPNRGVDCSGFTRYVLANAASIDLPHSAKGQSGFGTEVTTDRMRPGDLLFYSGDGGINHVAMYIGDGQVVHASTEKTGIKTSPYDYRKPVKIVSLLS